MGDPHERQNHLVSSAPLLPLFVKLPSSPDLIRKAVLGQRTPTLNALPVRRLQSSQWQ